MSVDEIKIVGRNENLEFWSTVGFTRDVIDGGGVDGTTVEVTDRELASSEYLRSGEDLSDIWDSYVETQRDHTRGTTRVRFRGTPVIHSMNWEAKRVQY